MPFLTHMKFKRTSEIFSFLSSKPSGPCLVIIFLFFLIFYAPQVQALDPTKSVRQYIIDSWTTDNGLPQNYIGKIVQTDDGYLWLATQQGLARFNGTNFRTFDQWNTPEIKAIAIQALYKGHDGTLWIGTRGGGLTGLKDGKFETYTSRDGLSSDFISSLCEDESGNLWIGSENGSLSIMKDGKFKAVPVTDNFSIINHIYRDNSGNMWIATNKGMVRSSEGKSVLYSTVDGLSSNRVTTVFEDRSENLWIGTEGGGLNRFRGGKFECFTARNGLCNDAVVTIFEDRAGNLWIGTRGGLARLKNGQFESFTTKDGLSNNAITFLYEDYEGGLWIGTHNGLNRLKDSKVFTYSAENGLPNDFIWSIFEDSKRNIWMGTYGTGLVRMKNGEIENFSVKDGLPSGVVRPIWEDRKGSLWIGTPAGLVRFRNGKFTSYTMKDGLSNELIRSIYEDSKGTLWIGTDDGLNWYRDGEFGIFDLEGGLEEREVVYSILEDRERILWIATYNGLIKIKDGSFKRFGSKDGLGHARVFSILQDSSGNMWIGTNGGGLTRLKNGKFTSFTKSDGLPDNVIYRILEDKKKNIWMSSNQGIFSLSIGELDDFAEGRTNSLKPDTYGKAEGMKSLECNGGSSSAGCVTADGKLWFPTLKGAVAIDPEQKGKNEMPPPVKVENVIVDDRLIPLGSDTILEPGARRFEFHYAALTFLAPEKVRFKFKLENFEEDWVDAEGRREAYYTNVPPGFYRFRVIACNNDGVWNTDGASFEFYLKPHFYQTLWFYLVCGIGIVLSGVGVYQLRVRQLRKHKKRLEKRVEERTNELEDANKKLQQEITERKQAEKDKERILQNLNERVKEMSCLYRVNEICRKEDISIEERLDEIVKVLPAGWQFPEITGSCVIFKDKKYKTKNFKRTKWMQRADIVVNNKKTGQVEICYLEEKPENDEGPFLKEERNLINAVAERLEQTVVRKRTEEALRTEKAYLEQLFESAQEAIVMVDNKHRILSINQEFTRLFGYKRNEALGCLIDELVLSEELIEEAVSFTEQLSEGKKIAFESIRQRKDGRLIHVLATGSPIIVGNERVGYFCIYRDITKRKKAEEEVKRRGVQASLIYKVGQRVSGELELQALLSEIVTAVRDAFDYYGVMLLLLDEEGKDLNIQSIAGGYVDIFPEDLCVEVGRGLIGLAAESGITQVTGDVNKNPHFVYLAEEKTKSELSVPIKRGERIIGVLDIQSDEFEAFDNTDVAAMETLSTQIATAIENARLYEQAQCEIDERKVVEKQLEDFAYIVSHDLKAPLRAVNQLATWISEDYAKSFDEEGKEQMNLLIGRVKRMSSLIDGILEYSRIGRIKGKEEEVDLNIVAKETIEILAPPENIQVIIENELPVVFGDRVRIGQVFQNLISNAMKYMDKPEGEIKIDCKDEGSHWKISVADNGPGIERKYYEKIFQIFQTLESKDTRESTGIGLTLVKKIVELHGGNIWVKSEVGKGSTFLFTIKKK